MSKVLIVDDEVLFLKSLSDGLKINKKMKGIEIMTAENGRVAMETLNSNPDIDLVITDIRMPEVDGFKLIAHMSRKYAATPIIVMTAFGSKDVEKKIKESGILHYIEKPIDFDELLEKIFSELSVRKRGTLRGVNLSTFLQIIGMERMTCTLTVSSGEKKGQLYVLSGEIINAKTGFKNGLEAAMDVVTWEGVTIDIGDLESNVEKKIAMNLESLLLEAYRRKDEVADLREAVMNLDREENKEVKMDVQTLNKAIDVLKSNLGAGLLATDIFTASDAQSIAGWNSNPTACALFAQIVNGVNDTLSGSGFPVIGKYILMDLVDDKMIVIIPMDEFMWSMYIDSRKAPLGLVLNIALPKAVSAFEQALVG